MDAIGVASTSRLKMDETPPKIQLIYHNGSYLSIAYNESIELDLNDIMWALYNKFNEETNHFLTTLYIPMIMVAVSANILVIAVILKYRYMRSVTNYFVVNLSIADLLVSIICMPVAVSQSKSMVWSHSELMCKVSSYLQGVSVAASVFTIMAMSIDRYLAISNPMAFRRVFNRKSTILVIAAIWLAALSIFAPVLKGMTLHSPRNEFFNITFEDGWTIRENSSHDDLRTSQVPPNFYICTEDFRHMGIQSHHFGIMCFIFVYAVPGFVVILAYSMMGRTLCSRKPPFDCDSAEGSASSQQSFRLVRERRRIAWILLFLAVLFALCWLPYNVLRLLLDLGVVEGRRSITNALSYFLFLGHANSALNPVVYCFMTRNFRRSVAEILFCGTHDLARRKPRHKSVMIENACGGCNVPGTRRGLLRQRNKLPGCDCGIPMSHHAVIAMRRTATSSNGYDSFYSRLSSHRRRYMLRSIRHAQQEAPAASPPANVASGDREQPEYGKNRLESRQPRRSTLCITDEQRRCP